MQVLQIEKTNRTPAIDFNIKTGVFSITGRSIMENTVGFYAEVMDAIKKYANNPARITVVKIQVDYFNTASSKSILEMLKKFEAIHKSGHPVKVNWYFDDDDEDMIDAGEDYQAIIKIPFSIIPITDCP